MKIKIKTLNKEIKEVDTSKMIFEERDVYQYVGFKWYKVKDYYVCEFIESDKPQEKIYGESKQNNFKKYHVTSECYKQLVEDFPHILKFRTEDKPNHYRR